MRELRGGNGGGLLFAAGCDVALLFIFCVFEIRTLERTLVFARAGSKEKRAHFAPYFEYDNDGRRGATTSEPPVVCKPYKCKLRKKRR